MVHNHQRLLSALRAPGPTDVFGALLGCAILVAALNPAHLPPIADATSNLVASALSAAGLSWLLLRTRRADPPSLPWIALAPIGLLLAAVLSLATHPATAAFTWGATNLAWLGAAAVLFALLAQVGSAISMHGKDLAILRMLAGALLIAGTLTSGIEMLQAARPGWGIPGWVAAMPRDLSPYGNLLQRNHAAALDALGLLALIYLAQSVPQRAAWRRGLQWAVAFTLTMGVVLTASRTGLAFLAVAAGYAAWEFAPKTGRPHRRIMVTLVGMLLGAMTWIAVAFAVSRIASGADVTAAGRLADAGNAARLALWSQAWHMLAAHPWTGAGWGSFSAYALVGALTSSHAQFANNAHSLPLQILAETGLLGLLLTGGPLALAIVASWTQAQSGTNPQVRFALAACVLIGGYSLIEYPLWSMLFLVPFALLSGVLLPGGVHLPRRGFRWSGVAGSAGALAVMAGSIIALAAYPGVSGQTVRASAGVASPLQPDAPAAVGVMGRLAFAPEQALNAFLVMPIAGPGLPARIDLGNRVAAHYTTPAILEKLAGMYLLDGQPVQSAARLAAAARIDPRQEGAIRALLRQAAAQDAPGAAVAQDAFDRILHVGGQPARQFMTAQAAPK